MKKRIISIVMAVLLLPSICGVYSFAAAAPMAEPVFVNGEPSGLLVLPDGSMLVADTFQKVILRIKDGEVEIFAGRQGVIGLNGEPIGGYNDAEYEDSAFMSPWDLSPFLNGYAVTDTENHVVRFIDPKEEIVRTAVGTGKPGLVNRRGTNAAFNRPTGITTDSAGNIYVADTGNHVIRRVDTNGNVTTYAGTVEGCQDGARSSAAFREPTGLFWHGGALYVADSGNHRICVIRDGVVSTISGGSAAKTGDAFYEGGYVDGSIDAAMFSNPQGVAVVADGSIYVSDTGNGAIRVIDTENGRVRTVARTSGSSLFPVSPRALALHGDDIYVGDIFAKTVFSLSSKVKTFTDVKPGDWYYDAVAFATSNGLFLGVSENDFAPNGSMTRGMFVTVLSRACLNISPNTVIKGERTFSDVPAERYYANAVSWAADNGITSGTGENTFSPNALVTREEMAAFLYNFVKYMELELQSGGDKNFNEFEDSGKAAPWAVEALSWAVEHGVLSGNDKGMLLPKNTATRAQAAQILMNFFQQYDR